MADCIRMNSLDNVATVLRRVEPGDALTVTDTAMTQVGSILATEQIPYAHKICLQTIPLGGDVIKYGQIIGRATCEIPAGSYAHVHNIVSIAGSVGR